MLCDTLFFLFFFLVLTFLFFPYGTKKGGEGVQTFVTFYTPYELHLHLHLVIWQTLLSKATYNWGVHKAIHLEEAIRQRKCS